jgi:DNA mismatch endonuclease (patch repair protein)
MTDCFTKTKRSQVMSKIRSSGNAATELRFIRMLRSHGVSGWRRGSKLPGKPDFLFAKQKLAVFIDGDFWHGNPRKFRLPKTNRAYWSAKIMKNRKRDLATNGILRKKGWKVLRIWQSSLANAKPIMSKLKLLL